MQMCNALGSRCHSQRLLPSGWKQTGNTSGKQCPLAAASSRVCAQTNSMAGTLDASCLTPSTPAWVNTAPESLPHTRVGDKGPIPWQSSKAAERLKLKGEHCPVLPPSETLPSSKMVSQHWNWLTHFHNFSLWLYYRSTRFSWNYRACLEDPEHCWLNLH